MDGPSAFRRLESTRVLAIGGLLLVAGGMVVGEIYAIYISHAANAAIGRNWSSIVESAGRGDLAQLRVIMYFPCRPARRHIRR